MQKNQQKTLIFFNRAVFILSLIGFIIAIYVLQSFVRKTPIVCVNSGCEQVRKNPASYIFGIPVPAFGLVGYFFLALFAFIQAMNNKRHNKLLSWMLAIAIFGTGFVTWFTYTEIFVIKAICTWCAVSAVNMVIILSLLIISYKFSKK